MTKANTKKVAKQIMLADVKANKEFCELIRVANENMGAMGYTEHGIRHVGFVSKTTSNILRELGYDDRTVELGAIAGWIHDIGNAVNRVNHGHTGAVLAFNILTRMGMDAGEIATIIGAIGNHEEQTGSPVSAISSALIIADKSDAHRSRVRRNNYDINDIHDRVNLAIIKNFITIDKENREIKLFIFMDTNTSATMEYLQIYLSRIVLSEKASKFLGCNFELIINDAQINRKYTRDPSLKLSGQEKEVSEEDC